MAKVTQINAPNESLALKRVSKMISEQEGNIAFFSLPSRCEALQKSGVSQRIFTGDSRFGCVQQFINEAVKNLRQIVDSTGAFIVISFSWRHVGLQKLQELWHDWALPGKVIGCTPGWWGDEETFDSRGAEIQKWIERSAIEPFRYVIIDDFDDSEAQEKQRDCWIRVNPHCGLSKDNAYEAICILQNQANNVRIASLNGDSKRLAYLLRHDTLYEFEPGGWRRVSDLIDNHGFSLAILEFIVTNETNGRYEFSSDKSTIRARWGHSIPISLGVESDDVLDTLYHGTAERYLQSIEKDGIKRRGRQFVHLTDDRILAMETGKRHGNPVVLTINAKAMREDGVKFWKLSERIWLTKQVDVQYLEKKDSKC